MFNRYATYTQNGVPHKAPPGFDDDDFTYVLTPGSPGAMFEETYGATPVGFTGPLNGWVLQSNILPGNDITITLVNTGGTNALSITVTGHNISVTLDTTVGVVNTTIALFVAAINANAQAAALVTAYVIGNGSVRVAALTIQTLVTYILGPSGTNNFQQTFRFLTQADSIFIWHGIEFQPTNSTFGSGVRIRYNNVYLSDDYLYGGGLGNALGGCSIAPAPVFPIVDLPPLSLLDIDVVNPDPSSFYTTYAVILRGFKRRPVGASQ